MEPTRQRRPVGRPAGGGRPSGSRARRRGRRRRITRKQRLARVRRLRILLGSILLALLAGTVFLILTQREEKEEVFEINAACREYQPLVEEIAARYGMSDYVELILAVMMQESSGQGTDVMQAAEGQFNTRYPKEPGGIGDAAYSIECGVQELKYALEMAQAEGPGDLQAIALALQGYNFGAYSYLNYMEEKGEDTWSHETAAAFAQMASGGVRREETDGFYEAAGPWKYGDQYYPEHVLRYYHP